ncbi:unnamed protein product [Leuciscus chuanchicus]
MYRTDGRLFNFNRFLNFNRFKAKSKVNYTTVTELQNADDNVITAHSTEDLQVILHAFAKAYRALGLKLNIKKTQVLYQSHANQPATQPTIKVDNTTLENVDYFPYLSSLLSSKADIDSESRCPPNPAVWSRVMDHLQQAPERNEKIPSKILMKDSEDQLGGQMHQQQCLGGSQHAQHHHYNNAVERQKGSTTQNDHHSPLPTLHQTLWLLDRINRIPVQCRSAVALRACIAVAMCQVRSRN